MDLQGDLITMNHFSASRRTVCFLAALVVSTTLHAKLASAASPAERYVERVGNGILAAARAGSVSQFRSLMQRNGAISTIAIYSLGPYRKKLPAARKREYYKLVSKHISKVFANHSKKLAGQSLTASSSRSKGRSVIVKSKLKYSSGKTSNVTWRLIKRGSGFKVFDVNVQGIWLASTQKTDFISILRRNKGDINALFSYLKK